MKVTTTLDLIERFSSLTTMKRIIALCLRFVHNTRSKDRIVRYLTTSELQGAMNCMVRLVQNIEFYKEIRDLSEGRALCSASSLLSLNAFLDDIGILRVGGRLRYANLNYNQKHPILLPSSNHLTKMIFREAHIVNCHCGIQATLYAVRQAYWPIKGRNIAKQTVRSCITCFRFAPTTPSYVMGDLPKDRLVSARPFENVGVDYCGPFFIKEKQFRNRNKIKIYVAVFVCLVTKAVHLEVISDLTTEAFIAGLRRFFVRRGRARIIYSDNATNFVGANNQLKQLYDLFQLESHCQAVDRFCVDKGISWKFILPRAPHFGGIWEAAVKGFKYHMRRILGETLFTFEQFSTFAIEIEAILNSRPLTTLSSDPNDNQALTPAHFLIGTALNTIPADSLMDVPSNKLSVWQHIEKMKQIFWRRWSKEYLNELQQRSKWFKTNSPCIKIGTLVLIKEDNTPALHWKMGRVVAVHPGDDNIIRVVTIKTDNGIYKRNVRKLAPLPIE